VNVHVQVKGVLLQAIKAYGEMELQLHSLLTFTLDGGKLLA
jgi:hypothetical protein